MISIYYRLPRKLPSMAMGVLLVLVCCAGVFFSASPKAEPLKAEAFKAEAAKAETLKAEPLKPQPLKTATLKVVVPPWSNDPNSQNAYFIKLLTMAFSKTEATDGSVVIQKHTENLTGIRFVADLKNNKTVDVIWHGTNLQREQDLIAIPISLTRELNEYRVLLIRKEDQEKFDQVKSLVDLRKFTAGTAIDWPSRDILLHNDLPVMAVANTNLLYTMLKMKRFDYMSRNMFEVWEEAERYEKEGLVVEKNLLLHGGVPFYFFVSKANPQLAERIERGLRIAIADGDFEKLFLSESRFKRGAAELENSKRLLQLHTKFIRLASLSSLWLVLCLSSVAFAETTKQKIVVPAWGGGANSPNDYFYRVLNLILAKTEASYGAAEIVPFPEVLTATRYMADLKKNKTVDLLWHGASRLYERELLAIPVSLTKELNEYRVLLIRKEDQPRFSTVKTVEDMKEFLCGSGIDWPSRDVALSNGLPVLGVTNPALLFNMLKAKRFDYISRNLFEIWGESERFAKEGLAMEQTLVVHGGEPFYFFVSPANPNLARRIEQGLKIAIADGSFEAVFASDEGMRRGQQELEKGNRRLLKLDMNYTPVNNELPLSH